MALQTGVESEILDLCARILRETDARLDAKRGTSDQRAHPGGMLQLAFFAAKQDPVAYREGLLGHSPRALAVLLLVAKKADGDHHFPWGMAAGFRYNSHTEVTRRRSPRSKWRPMALSSQADRLSDRLRHVRQSRYDRSTELRWHAFRADRRPPWVNHFKDGRVEQSNFDSYLPMRIDEVPLVETHLIKNAEVPGGIGEAPTAIVSAAVTNAIFAATGKRLRSLPIDTDSLRSSS